MFDETLSSSLSSLPAKSTSSDSFKSQSDPQMMASIYEAQNENYDTEQDLLMANVEREDGLCESDRYSEKKGRRYKIENRNVLSRILSSLPQNQLQKSSNLTSTLNPIKQTWLNSLKGKGIQEEQNSYQQVNSRDNETNISSRLELKNSRQISAGTEANFMPTYNPQHNRRAMTNCLRSILMFLLIFLLILLTILTKLHPNEHQNKQSRTRISLLNISKNEKNELDYDYPVELNKHWLINTKKCRIPALDPWDSSIEDYILLEEPLDCNKMLTDKLGKSMSYVKDNKLFFTDKAIKEGYLKNNNCCMREVIRPGNNDDDLEFGETCSKISENGISVSYEIVQVECFNSKSKNKTTKEHSKYMNVHSFIVPKFEEVDVLVRAMDKNLNMNEYYNVILIGMDTMSRLNAYRQLPKTLKVLREKFNAIEFYGYNKVGENTFPNLIPFLTGLSPSQLVDTKCWLAKNYTDSNERGDEYLNNCKFLWNFFQEFGYMTYFSEDWPQASTFNYLKPGFKQEPTAYYGRPFTLARQPYLTGSTKKMECDFCVLDKPIVSLSLDYLKSYMTIYQNNPHFAFQWMNCPHHNDMNGASSVDSFVADFFNNIYNTIQLERTFVIFFSDHGWRWNDFIGTRIGHYESSLPLMTISPPKKFIQQHPDLYHRLKSHTKTLFTPFDMFKTIIDIRNLSRKNISDGERSTEARQLQLNSDNYSSHKNQSSLKNQSIDETVAIESSQQDNNKTIFTQISPIDGTNFKQKFQTFSLLDPKSLEITSQRSCIEAGVPDNYCVCHEFHSVATDSPDVLAAAYYFVYVHLDNRVLEGADICRRLDLKKVNKAERYQFDEVKLKKLRKRRATLRDDSLTTTIKPTTFKIKTTTTEEPFTNDGQFLPNIEYNLRVITKPGNGAFQEVIRYYGNNTQECNSLALKAKKVLDGETEYDIKRKTVINMNQICKFSVHSDSISRLNLYKNQSKCVKNNSELHKVCYCKNLPDEPEQ